MSKPALEVKEMTTQNLWELADSRLLYAILDACDAEAVAFKMKELGEEVAVCRASLNANPASSISQTADALASTTLVIALMTLLKSRVFEAKRTASRKKARGSGALLHF